MDQLTCDGNAIYDGDRIIGTISMSKSSIEINGSVSIILKRDKAGYSILEDNLPMGRIEKNLKLTYQGKIYETERKELYDFVTGKTNKLDIFSSGSLSGTIERENSKLVVKSDQQFEKTPFIVYLAIFSRYRLPAYGTRHRAQALPSPYKEAYYALIIAFFAAFVFLSIYNFNTLVYTFVLLILIIGQFTVYFLGKRKLSGK